MDARFVWWCFAGPFSIFQQACQTAVEWRACLTFEADSGGNEVEVGIGPKGMWSPLIPQHLSKTWLHFIKWEMGPRGGEGAGSSCS